MILRIKKNISYLTIIFIILTISSCGYHNNKYIDPHFPTSEPRLFAEDIFSSLGMVQCLSVSSDLNEYYFQPSLHHGGANLILRLKGTIDNYSIDTLFDTKRFSEYKFCVEPWITYNMDELYFMLIDDKNERDLFKMDRMDNSWSKPHRLDSNINSSWNEAHPSLSKNKTLYFHSWDKTPLENNIYYSKFSNGKFLKRKKINELGENGDAGDPAIAPDESFIIFVSSRAFGYGNTDLYISFNKNGTWTNPKNLGPDINTPKIELGPTISPDGRFLFFYRRNKWKNARYSKIYWVDIEEVIKENKLFAQTKKIVKC
jgi:hypothetical protein